MTSSNRNADAIRGNRSRTEALVTRLRYLWAWELFDSFFFPALVLLIGLISRRAAGPLTWYSVTLVTWLLWQGAAYWQLKLAAVQTRAPIPSPWIRCFAVLRWVNWALLAAAPLLVAFQLIARVGLTAFDATLSAMFYILAVLEQINYYHYQLMYDHPRDWRTLLAHRKL
jgi:hypothetical protein